MPNGPGEIWYGFKVSLLLLISPTELARPLLALEMGTGLHTVLSSSRPGGIWAIGLCAFRPSLE